MHYTANKVLKFGGTSMGSAESLNQVAQIILAATKRGSRPIVVCSAMSQVTNKLIQIGTLSEQGKQTEALKVCKNIQNTHYQTAKDLGILEDFIQESEALFEDLQNFIRGVTLIHEFSQRSEAYLTSFGEQLSVRLLTSLLNQEKDQAQYLDSTFIKTKGKDFLTAEVDWKATRANTKNALSPAIRSGVIPIVTGFMGTCEQDLIMLLGRGGSDYSAAIIGVCMNIKTVEIWTDVDGFMSADPRVVRKAQVIDEMGYIEVSELCAFGAKVLHPKTIRPVIDEGGEVWIKNTFNPTAPGTRIVQKSKYCTAEVLSIAAKPAAIISLDLFGVPLGTPKSKVFAQIFSVVEAHNICVDAIAASEGLISLAIEESFIHNRTILNELKAIAPLEIAKDRTILTLVSPQCVQGSYGTFRKIFGTLGEAKIPIEMTSQNIAEVAMIVVIKSGDNNKALKAVHKNLIEHTS